MTIHPSVVRRLSAIQGERGTPSVTTPRTHPWSSAQRLLKVATALSDGATKLHAQLRHLEPADRDAILDLVTEQVSRDRHPVGRPRTGRGLHRRRVAGDRPPSRGTAQARATCAASIGRSARVEVPATIPPG